MPWASRAEVYVPGVYSVPKATKWPTVRESPDQAPWSEEVGRGEGGGHGARRERKTPNETGRGRGQGAAVRCPLTAHGPHDGPVAGELPPRWGFGRGLEPDAGRASEGVGRPLVLARIPPSDHGAGRQVGRPPACPARVSTGVATPVAGCARVPQAPAQAVHAHAALAACGRRARSVR